MKKRFLCALGAAAIMATAVLIVYKFRIYNGKQQYRRWNETRGYWVDPYWIDVPH